MKMSFLRSCTSITSKTSKLIENIPKLVQSTSSKSSRLNSKFGIKRMGLSPLEETTAALEKLNLEKYCACSTLKDPVKYHLPTFYERDRRLFPGALSKPLLIEPSLLTNVIEKFDPLSNLVIEEPLTHIVPKEAARLVVIRRRKMRRHKLKKLRKRMKFVFLKKIQKREYKKEKEFQASQMAKIRAAEAFDPVAYVNGIIAKTKEKPAPTTWKGKRLPKDVIRILIENDGKYVPDKKGS